MTSSPQLKTLKVKSLFGYKDIELSFNDITVLVGRNGLGKTTILKILNAMLTDDFNCPELKLCQGAVVTFTNKASISYDPVNNIQSLTKETIINVINEHLHNLKEDELFSISNELQEKVFKNITLQYFYDKNNKKRIQQAECENSSRNFDFYCEENSIHMSKALKEYINNNCEIRYISTINMSANAQQDIKMSSGKEKNILNWELNQELKELAKDKSSIYTSRFIKIASDMLSESGKRLHLRTKNKICSFDTIDQVRGDYIKIEHLSSGERQLLYILSRVANTKNKQTFVLMDEPEISLHLNWQEKLISGIKYLNERCQIIIVTHSPAIVMDGYMDSYIDMENITTEYEYVRVR